MREYASVEDSQFSYGSPDLDSFILVHPVVGRIKIPKVKLVVVEGKFQPIVAVALVDVENIIWNLVGFAESHVHRPKIVDQTLENLAASPSASEWPLASPKIEYNFAIRARPHTMSAHKDF